MHHDTVAVVGSRQASQACLAATRAITRALVEAGWVIVSGLAAGVDTAAHKTAINTDGRTIAVLGNGHNHTYPPGNEQLQQHIAREHLVLSQFDPEAPPDRPQFSVRNRVVAAISQATVVVDAAERSGTLTTVQRALEFGRPVYVPDRLAGCAAGCRKVRTGCFATRATWYGNSTLIETVEGARHESTPSHILVAGGRFGSRDTVTHPVQGRLEGGEVIPGRSCQDVRICFAIFVRQQVPHPRYLPPGNIRLGLLERWGDPVGYFPNLLEALADGV